MLYSCTLEKDIRQLSERDAMNISLPKPSYKPFRDLDCRAQQKTTTKKTETRFNDCIKCCILVRSHLISFLGFAVSAEQAALEFAKSAVDPAQIFETFQT